MARMTNLVEIWNNGATSPYFRPPGVGHREWFDNFKVATGADSVVALRWLSEGQEHQLPYPAQPLPDLTGLIVPRDGHSGSCKRLQVINADGSERVVISVPLVDKDSRPDDGWLSLVFTSAYGVDDGIEGNDGHTDCIFEFDWATGGLRHWAHATRHW